MTRGSLFTDTVAKGHEGIVIRNAHSIHHSQWATNAAKMVRGDHNQCPDDWKSRPIIKNQVRTKGN